MQTDRHQIARQQLQARLDGLLGPDEQRALERHLAECPDCQAYAETLDAFEARLRASLQERWPETAPAQDARPELQALLRKIKASSRRNPMQQPKTRTLPVLAWIGLVALIVIVISFSVRSLVPEPANAPEPSQSPATLNAPVIPPTQEAVPTEAASVPQGTITATMPITSTGGPPVNERTGLFPGVDFSFVQPLPASPDQLNVYRLALGEALSPENAQAQAQALGLDGRVFSQPREGMSDSLYAVTDGYGLARFLNFPSQFLYWPGASGLKSQHGELPPFEQQAASAEQFLQERGLLDEPYRVEPLEAERGGVSFVRLLDGLPVIHGIGVNRSLIGYNRVVVDPQGQVLEVTHSQPGYEALGQYPILSAGQAWARLSQDNALQRLRYAVLDPQKPDSYQTWLRELPRDQPLDLYGYPEVLTPAAGGPTPLVLFRDLPTSGYTTGMQPGDFLHVWGQIVEAEAGRPVLQVEGWDYSEPEDTNLEGVLTRAGEISGTLTTDDGLSVVLNELPADLPDGARLQARGVVIDGVLDWSSLGSGELSLPYGNYLSCGGGGGGGGGGGPLVSNFGEGLLAIPNLSDQPVTAPPVINNPGLPPVGTDLEGVTGIAFVIRYQYPGYLETNINLNVDAGVLGEFPTYLSLEGEGLAGIEAYHNLPVRIWGKVVRQTDYQAVVQVDRYEPAYPDLHIHAWLGTQAIVTLEDQPVVLFTTQDGRQYVLKNSILHGTGAMVGREGEAVIYEGVAIPGESYGGYPVLRELSGSMAEGATDTSQYQITQNVPAVIDQTQSSGSQRQQLSGNVTIDQVELAYAAIATNHCTTADAANQDMDTQLLVQPIWRFIGSFEDGRRMEIQVSALPEEYFGS